MTADPQNTFPSKVGDTKYLRAPWWMYLVAASFAMLLAIPFLTFWGPADVDGLQASFEDGSMRLNAVEPGSYLANAGLVAGDRVLAIDNLPLRNTRDLEIVQANAEVDRPQHWQLLRGAERLELQIPPQRATVKNRLDHAFIGFSLTAMACF